MDWKKNGQQHSGVRLKNSRSLFMHWFVHEKVWGLGETKLILNFHPLKVKVIGD